VMQHDLTYTQDGADHRYVTSLVVEGDDSIHTAMAKTVGYPLGIAAKHILLGNIEEKGALIPTIKSIYQPVLEELESLGIKFIKEDQSF